MFPEEKGYVSQLLPQIEEAKPYTGKQKYYFCAYWIKTASGEWVLYNSLPSTSLKSVVDQMERRCDAWYPKYYELEIEVPA